MAKHWGLPDWYWTFGDWITLTAAQQGTYVRLASSQKTSLCGLVDFIPGRFTLTAADMTVSDFTTAVKDLEAAEGLWIIVDEDTQEILCRRFVRDDRILFTPNIAQGMISAFDQVMSPKLRAAFETELHDLYREFPDLAGWKGVEKGNPVLMERFRADHVATLKTVAS